MYRMISADSGSAQPLYGQYAEKVLEHPHSLSVAMVMRRVPGIGHREAALLVEFSRRVA